MTSINETEHKTIDTVPMVDIEMCNINSEENKFINYKIPLKTMSQEVLAELASKCKITRSRDWANTVWETGNVIFIAKNGEKLSKNIKEAVKMPTDDYTKLELKLPTLKIILTDGFKQFEIITPISVKLGIIDQWMRDIINTGSIEQHPWFKQTLMTGNLLYYEVPVQMTQTLNQLQMRQILFDLYGSNIIYIFVKSRIKNPIMKMFESRELEFINSMKNSSQKSEGISFKAWFARELRSCLPKCLEINEIRDPIVSTTKNGTIPWDIMITDDRRSFRFDDELLPNAMVAVIDCRPTIILSQLMEIEKMLSYNKNQTVLQCMIAYNQTWDEKLESVFNHIMASRDSIKLDLILIIGIGAFIKLGSGKYIYLKDEGGCLASLYYLIGQYYIRFNPSDLGQYVGCPI